MRDSRFVPAISRSGRERRPLRAGHRDRDGGRNQPLPKESKMQLDGFRRFLPYTGLICAVSLIAYMVIGGSTPTDTSSTAKFLDYYGPDNNSAGFFANFIFANLFAVFALFFVTEIRATLRSGEA